MPQSPPSKQNIAALLPAEQVRAMCTRATTRIETYRRLVESAIEAEFGHWLVPTDFGPGFSFAKLLSKLDPPRPRTLGDVIAYQCGHCRLSLSDLDLYPCTKYAKELAKFNLLFEFALTCGDGDVSLDLETYGELVVPYDSRVDATMNHIRTQYLTDGPKER